MFAMASHRCSSRALVASALLLLPACAAPQPALSPGALPSHAVDLGSATGDLVYGSGTDGRHIYIFSYPHVKFVGKFAAPAGTIALQGLCSDSSGNVFVTNVSKAVGSGVMQGHVYEYAHGDTQILKTFTFEDVRPFGCSVDPSSGTLAVASAGLASRGGSLTTIAPDGSGNVYYSYNIRDYYYCAYDGTGNLFVNGRGDGTQMYLDEVPKGKSGFVELSLDKYVSVSGMGALQWDGSHLTLEDLSAGAIYRLSVAGSTATVVGTSRLDGWNGSALSTIAEAAVLAPTGVSETKIGFWKYPAGGKATRLLSIPSGLFGLAISVATQR
jgi:hypothetical protein